MCAFFCRLRICVWGGSASAADGSSRIPIPGCPWLPLVETCLLQACVQHTRLQTRTNRARTRLSQTSSRACCPSCARRSPACGTRWRQGARSLSRCARPSPTTATQTSQASSASPALYHSTSCGSCHPLQPPGFPRQALSEEGWFTISPSSTPSCFWASRPPHPKLHASCAPDHPIL